MKKIKAETMEQALAEASTRTGVLANLCRIILEGAEGPAGGETDGERLWVVHDAMEVLADELTDLGRMLEEAENLLIQGKASS